MWRVPQSLLHMFSQDAVDRFDTDAIFVFVFFISWSATAPLLRKLHVYFELPVHPEIPPPSEEQPYQDMVTLQETLQNMQNTQWYPTRRHQINVNHDNEHGP